MATPRTPRDPTTDRSSGIALLVVMVAFVLLYLVVYQLHFSTAMESRLSQIRYSEVESSIGLQSAALYVVTLLVEDLKASMSSAASSGSSASGAVQPSTRTTTAVATPGGASGGGGGSASSAGTSKSYDFLHKNIFRPNQQSVGDVSVRVRIRDGESAWDVNRLFDYARIPGEETAEGSEDIRDEDLAALEGAGAEGEAAAGTLREQLLAGVRTRREKTLASGASGATATRKAGDSAETGETATGSGVDGEITEYDEDLEFVPPTEERIQATREMLRRAILAMFTLNESEYGYRYGERYDAASIASDIVAYVLERRNAVTQNRIFLVTELLNIPGITREVFYGPLPEVPEGESVSLGNGYALQRDEFGDVAPVYEFPEDPMLEQQRSMLTELEGQFGRFADLPGMGRLMSNALTRGMSEPPVELDEFGREFVREEPRPVGLRDLFTTFSTGKININTAPLPVLAGLLLSVDELQAEDIALQIRDYRNRFQEEISEEGVGDVDSEATPDLGQPRRQARTEEEEAERLGLGSTTSTPGSYTSEELEGYAAPYEDLETNYFTDLKQLELIDGTDGGVDDILRSDEGVQRVSAEDDTVYRRVLEDYRKVAVFGSTYFEAELKAKPQKGIPGRTGMLVVKRDPGEKRIEILMWRTQQK